MGCADFLRWFVFRKPVQPPVILPKPAGPVVSLSSEFFQNAVEKSLQPGSAPKSLLSPKRKLSEEDNASSQVTKVLKPNPQVQAKPGTEYARRVLEHPKASLEEPQPQTAVETKELPKYAQDLMRSFSEKVRPFFWQVNNMCIVKAIWELYPVFMFNN